jgi:trans-2,3-dihydro-3-hydroxyanthranilate isomerase
MAELVDRSALERAQGRMEGAQALRTEGAAPDVHLYTRSADEFDLRARMFAPLDGVPEDPATGSANCALAALLTHYEPAADGSFQWRIAQGVEMGRPSTLEARTRKTAGVVADAWIGGYSVLVSEGFIQVE